jgi:sugar/nucleoside kinase (ribokinase family)
MGRDYRRLPSLSVADTKHDTAQHDVLTIGNAIVDVIANADDSLLIAQGLTKGSMELIDPERASSLYAAMPPGIEASGGSAANTAVGVASFGGRAAFIGKVRDDDLGQVFAHDIRASGVTFSSSPAAEGLPTAISFILVTPDAERTMSTSLGIAAEVTVDDVDEALVKGAAITYCEGYLWDLEPTKEAIRRSIAIAHGAGRLVALTLSDGFCVERHRAEFRALAEESVDVLFANEDEITSLYEVDHFDQALQKVRDNVDLAFLTRGPAGAVVVRGDEIHVVGAHPHGEVVDTTGAGDAFAAGAMFGLTHGCDLATCARLGSVAAGEVISHLGPRNQESFATLTADLLTPT